MWEPWLGLIGIKKNNYFLKWNKVKSPLRENTPANLPTPKNNKNKNKTTNKQTKGIEQFSVPTKHQQRNVSANVIIYWGANLSPLQAINSVNATNGYDFRVMKVV